MTQNDWKTFEGLDAEIFPEDRVTKGVFDRLIQTEGFFGLESKRGKLIGCLRLAKFGDDAGHIGRIGVLKSEQRKGLGSKMMEFAIKWFQDQGKIHRILLYTQDFNKPAQALYTKFGFQIVGTTWSFIVPYNTVYPQKWFTAQLIQESEIQLVGQQYNTTMPMTQIRRWLGDEQLVFTLKDPMGNIVGACRFTPSFPGCFPFELGSLEGFDDFLNGIKAYALPTFDYLRITFTDIPNLATLLEKRKCKLHHRLFKMQLEPARKGRFSY